MRGYLLILLVFSTIPFILARPHIGIIVYSWFGYMNPHRLTYGFANQFPFAMLLGGLTVLAWFFSREPKKLPVTRTSVLILIYTLWISFTTLFAIVPTEAFAKWEQVIKILFIALLTMVVINNRERIVALVWTMVVSLGFWGVKGGLFILASGGSNRVFGPPRSFIEDNNALAVALIMTLPLVRFLQLQVKQKWLKLALTGVMILLVFSILGSFSRGAALAGGAMLTVLWLRSRRRLILGVGLVAILGTALVFMPQKFYDRLATLEAYEEDGSANTRLDSWLLAYYVAIDRPLTGGGFQMYSSRETRDRYFPGSKLHNAHSIWFETLGEHGFIGLFLFVAIGASALLTCGRVRKRTRDDPSLTWAYDLASMLQVSIIGFAVGGTFLNQASFDYYWQLAALAVCVSVAVRKAQSEATAQRSKVSGRPLYRPQGSGSPA